jgi:hypothetical protein
MNQPTNSALSAWAMEKTERSTGGDGRSHVVIVHGGSIAERLEMGSERTPIEEATTPARFLGCLSYAA